MAAAQASSAVCPGPLPQLRVRLARRPRALPGMRSHHLDVGQADAIRLTAPALKKGAPPVKARAPVGALPQRTADAFASDLNLKGFAAPDHPAISGTRPGRV